VYDAFMLDLYHATRDDLIALIVAQREALADRDRRIDALETEAAAQRVAVAQLAARVGELLAPVDPDDAADGGAGSAVGPRGMPGLKPSPAHTRAPERRAPGRKRRARGAARPRMVATARQVHALACCPACGAPLAGGTVKRTRDVIEVPLAPVVVTEHVYLERRCPDCRRRCVPPPELDGVVVGQSRFGIRLTSLITFLREEARLPFAVMQRLLRTLYGVEVSVGALVGATARVAIRAEPHVTRIQAAIQASPVVHADETGWREQGRNGYVWTFSTPTLRSFVRGTREKAMLETAVGETFAGVLVSDFYAAYTTYAGRHQYCWAHLLRDIHELAVEHPRDAGVRGWADAVQDLLARARAFASEDPGARGAAARGFQADLTALCAPYLPLPVVTRPPPATAGAPPAAPPPPGPAAVPPQRTLCQRIEKHLSDLFVFVEDPAVPATNNAAERSLRHLVVSRKISGGTRSAAGSATKMRLATLFGTWRAQGLNPFDECRNLLATPQV
jgi:transposase